MKKIYHVGTRGSKLALWQANYAISLLLKAYPQVRFVIKTYSSAGDIHSEKPLPKIEGKGVFTKALDEALLKKEIDIAIHSQKDLPIDHQKNLITTAAVLTREKAQDILVLKKGYKFLCTPQAMVIGTSSTRRSAQLLALDNNLIIKDIRGNVETRIKKTIEEDGAFHATILAYAGVKRLNLLHHCAQILDFDHMLPAPAQASIAVQCLNDKKITSLCTVINHHESRLCTEAERGFLFGLGGGCSMPIAAYAEIKDQTIFMRTKVLNSDGSKTISLNNSKTVHTIDHAFDFGVELANKAIDQGALQLLVSPTKDGS